jgi:ketosteroid isomerase-like protein
VPTTAAEAVLEANEAFYAAFNEKDTASMDLLWARMAPVTCIHPHGNLLSGRETVMASWFAILANPAQAKIVSGGAVVQVAGDVAVVVCREFVSGTPVIATNVFVLESGHWRISHHHGSPVAWQAG